jgi:hypothetical protein
MRGRYGICSGSMKITVNLKNERYEGSGVVKDDEGYAGDVTGGVQGGFGDVINQPRRRA